MAKHGSQVGRKTEFGVVQGYDAFLKRYFVRCNCGEVFMVKTETARRSQLNCQTCFRKRQSEFGKMGNFVTNGKAV